MSEERALATVQRRASGAGRPRGSLSASFAPQLRHIHFSFLRSLIEGIPLRRSWETYLSHEEGPDHESHFAARARALMRQVRQAAAARDLEPFAAIALRGFRLPAVALRQPSQEPSPSPASTVTSAPEAPALPSLDEWIDMECGRTGTDPDFFTQAEWLEAYEEAMRDLAEPVQTTLPYAEPDVPRGIPAPSPASEPEADRQATRTARVQARLDALNRLAFELEQAPTVSDRLEAWLSPGLARALAATERNGRALPLLTVGDLITFITQEHHRWWVHVPRLGRVRAERVMRWIEPLADRVDRPLPDIAKMPLMGYLAEQKRRITTLESESTRTFGLVPLERLAVPPELDGTHGEFRIHDSNTFGAANDMEAIDAWLATRKRSAATARSYPRLVERFYLWALLVQRKPMSSLNQGDLIAYSRFLAKPPEHWIQRRRTGRQSAEWRPLRGPLDPRSLRLDMTVIASMFNSLHKGGYLRLNPAQDVRSALRLTTARIEIDRSFDEKQWGWLMTYWEQQYALAGPAVLGGPDQRPARAPGLRRTRLLLEMGATTGLRLVELVTTRRRQITRTLVEGQEVWLMNVLGKGGKEREVVLFDDVKQLLDAHHQDMHNAETVGGGDWLRTLDAPVPVEGKATELAPSMALTASLAPSPAETDHVDEGMLPLIGAVRQAFAAPGRKNADAYGALDPTALYQSLKRFLQAAATAAVADGAEVDGERLARASTHWLRHFFANNMADDNVSPAAMMLVLGHASLATSSVYLRQERRTLVATMNKVRRR